MDEKVAPAENMEKEVVPASVLREIIRTPAFREIIKLHAVGGDPEKAAQMTRTLIWEDVNFSMSLIGALPEKVNYIIASIVELGKQLSTFPPELLDDFLSHLIDGIDKLPEGEIPKVWGPVIEKALLENHKMRQLAKAGIYFGINSSLKITIRVLEKYVETPEKKESPLTNSIDPAILGKAISLFAKATNKSMANNPDFIKEVLANICFSEILKLVIHFTFGVVKAALLFPINWIKENYGKR